ncbi:MAG: HAMP domain-containing histidine kinase [Deltaproteobacteria bacterium]|nr:HAMP domain-containing histidine kinase [Deltaproteobacteria bacterium]
MTANELAEETKTLSRSLRSGTDAATDAAHDMRAPLSAILGAAELMRDGMLGPINQDQHDRLEDIHASAISLLRLVDRAMAVLRARAEEIPLDPRRAAVGPAVGEVCTAMEARAQEKKLAFVPLIDPGVEAIVDPRRVRHLAYCLIDAAFRDTASGSNVGVRVLRASGNVRIEVTYPSTSGGDRLRARFDATARQTEGEPDLMLARRLAAAMGGTAGVELADGSDVTLFAALPAA